jgi:hypothetical protein
VVARPLGSGDTDAIREAIDRIKTPHTTLCAPGEQLKTTGCCTVPLMNRGFDGRTPTQRRRAANRFCESVGVDVERDAVPTRDVFELLLLMPLAKAVGHLDEVLAAMRADLGAQLRHVEAVAFTDDVVQVEVWLWVPVVEAEA